MTTLPKVAIVGRPNVGKSTLFNRLIGRKEALVYDTPGVTRDRHYGIVEWSGVSFEVIDTGGFEDNPKDPLKKQMLKQLDYAMEEADFIWLLFDGMAGLQSEEKDFVDSLRKSNKPFFLLVNKIDHASHEKECADFYRLGISPLWMFSSEHGRALGDFLDYFIHQEEFKALVQKYSQANIEDSEVMKVAIIGRPNVGKSTLLNRLFGAPRAVVHDAPGTTRDPLNVRLTHEGETYEFIDTAGIRRKSHSEGLLEKVSVLKAFQKVEKSDFVLLVIDGPLGISAQDGKVAQEAILRKRPLLLLINKWDESQLSWNEYEENLRLKFPSLHYVPAFPISAKTGLGVPKIYHWMKKIRQEFLRKVSTSKLNNLFQKLSSAVPPPSVSGKSLNLFYITQTRVAPPHFVIFCNHPKLVPEHYRRYLQKGLRESFGFTGTPLIFEFRKKPKKTFHA